LSDYQQQLTERVSKLKSKSIVHMFRERVKASGPKRAARGRKKNVWSQLTWSELDARVRDLAHGLIALGVKPGDRVAVFGPTRLEWAIADFAIVMAGGVTVPIYASNTVEECVYILENSGAVAAFCDGDEGEKGAPGRLTRLLGAQQTVRALGNIIVFDDEAIGGKAAKAMSEVEKSGRAYGAQHPGELDARGDAVGPFDPACFIYTSGTTGNPKGVVLAHHTFVFEAEALNEMGIMKSTDVMLLFLPMAHVFGKTAAATWVGLGFDMAFCDNVDKILEYAAEAKPTVLPAVPRIFEKVYSGVLQKAVSNPGLQGKIAAWALGEFDKYARARMDGKDYSSVGLTIAKALVFKKIAAALKERLGGNIQLCVSGSAPLARKIAYFFEFNGLTILEAYGLTENCAGATSNRPGKNKIGTVGPAFPGTELKLADDGEILLRGPHLMKGYWQNPTATAEVLGDDGWFKTGDIGEMDSDGYVRITDRKKDLIKTSGGKYIAPQNLENALKGASTLISQVMIHGDRRKYVSVLFTLNEESARKLLADKGQTAGSLEELSKNAEVRGALQTVVDELNKTLPSYETIKKFEVLKTDFSVESGELTPSLKVKRKVITQRYMAVLDSMYDEKLD
jgi:long-chain acyl-CoA synthetase